VPARARQPDGMIIPQIVQFGKLAVPWAITWTNPPNLLS
jgi:hypothetical protein